MLPRRLRRGAAAFVLAALLGVVTLAAAPGPDSASQRERLASLRSELARLDAQAAMAAVEHNRALDRLDLIRARLRGTNAGIAKARRDLRRAQRQLAARLSEAYRSPPPTNLSLVLSSGSLSRLLATKDMLDRVHALDARTVSAVRVRQGRLNTLRRQLVAARTAARAQVASAQARRSQVSVLVDRRRVAFARADRDLRNTMTLERRRLARLAAQKRTATSPVPARRAANTTRDAASTPSAAQVNRRVFPIAGPTRFSDDWLAARAGGRLHEGIDLFANRGTPAVAIAGGTLSRVGWNGLGGWRLWLRDNAGTEYYYAHLDSFAPAAREGARVTAGTVVGYVGESGDAKGTSPHVHFEIHPGGGGPVRPYPIVAALPRV